MARRGDEAQAETLEIVERIVQRVDFKLAAIAGAGIDLRGSRGCAPGGAGAARSSAVASSFIAASSGAGAASVSGALDDSLEKMSAHQRSWPE